MTTTILPATPTTTLLEPSFVDLITDIEQDAELSEEHRRHWVCSSRQIAEGLDRPLAVIPARWSAIRIPVSQLQSRPRPWPTIRPTSKRRCAGLPRSTNYLSTEYD